VGDGGRPETGIRRIPVGDLANDDPAVVFSPFHSFLLLVYDQVATAFVNPFPRSSMLLGRPYTVL
jgi:hypothetical protein